MVGPGQPAPYNMGESEPEDEVDQLDSDSEGDDAADPNGPSASTKKAPRKEVAVVRKPGHSLLPAQRIENILDAEGAL